MRAIISGGGTAGHINPALAIAASICKNEPGSEILFIGTPGGMENTLVKKAGYNIKHIEIRGLKRSISADNIKTLFMAVDAYRKSKKIIKEFKPDIVIGTGGYVCGPPLLAACNMKIPTITHEQNVPPGMVIKMLASKADITAISFSKTKDFIKKAKRIELTGNPLREGIVSMKNIKRERPLVMMSGGSLGAEKINNALFEMLTIEDCNMFDVCASVGERYFEPFMEKVKKAGIKIPDNFKILPYIHNMDEVLAEATVAITRGGAITCSELSAVGKPAIIIPSPNVVADHQNINASFMQECGCAYLLKESELSGDVLASMLKDMISDKTKLEKMSECGKKAAVLGAAEKIYSLSKELIS